MSMFSYHYLVCLNRVCKLPSFDDGLLHSFVGVSLRRLPQAAHQKERKSTQSADAITPLHNNAQDPHGIWGPSYGVIE